MIGRVSAIREFSASLGKTYKGKVRQVGNYINPNNRSFGIEVSVPNPQNLLRPNQVAKLKVIDFASRIFSFANFISS
jgi:multidrug efflux pump subunit AcrA (membrane-fusion protein)